MPVSAAAVPGHFQCSGFTIVPVTASHVLTLEALPRHHDDPFDRLLIATAHAAPDRLPTADARLGPYGAMVTVV
jgi:PIN domain nuclease of toxin-antitoxin system